MADLAGTQVVEGRMVDFWTCYWSSPCEGQWMMHKELTGAVVVVGLEYAGLETVIECNGVDLLGQEGR